MREFTIQLALLVATLLLCACRDRTHNNDFWIQLSDNKGAGVSDLAISESGAIVFGTFEDGVFGSKDGGKSWQQLGLPKTQVWSLTIESNGSILVAAGEKGLFRIYDDGHAAELSVPEKFIMFIASIDSTLLLTRKKSEAPIDAPSYGEGLYVSSDRGQSWIGRAFLHSGGVAKVVQMSDGSILAVAMGEDIYRSIDRGYRWSPIGFGSITKWVQDIAVDSMGRFFVATHDSGLYRSDDGAKTWRRLRNGLTDSRVQAIIVAPKDNLYVSTYEGKGVFHSTNAGDNWQLLNSGLTNFNVACLALDANGFLYAGSLGGLYKSVKSVTSD